jgi:hypothetical protein
MSDEESTMNRFQTAGKDYQESLDSQDGKDGKSSKDGGGIKNQRESFQAYIPPEDKEGIEATWRKVKALCSLSDQEEPAKNDYYSAVVREGYNNLEKIAEFLDLKEEYERNKGVL